MQPKLTAGDTLNYRAVLPEYPASDGWSLKLRLIPRFAGTAVDVTAEVDGDAFNMRAGAGITSTWAPGRYGWALWVERGLEVYTVDQGQIDVLADPRTTAAPSDTRTHAERMLEAVEAVLEGRATQAHLEYTINGRQMRFIPPADLLALRDRYRMEVRAQLTAAGALPGARLLVRL